MLFPQLSVLYLLLVGIKLFVFFYSIFQNLCQFRISDGLYQVIIYTQLNPGFRIIEIVVAGEKKRNCTAGNIFFYPFQKVQAIFPWHFNVTNQELNGKGLKQLPCKTCVIGSIYLINSNLLPGDFFLKHLKG